MLRQLIVFAKHHLSLQKLTTGVLVRNPGSRRVLEKNNFEIVRTVINEGEYDEKFEGEQIWEMEYSFRKLKIRGLSQGC